MTETARHVGSGYSRVTLVGPTRRADLVLPSDEPLGMLMTDMLTVLDERPGSGRLVVMTTTGALIPYGVSLAQAGVLDGAVLRLVAEQSAPPPPVVNDVTEETSVDIGARGGRWSQRTSEVFAICGGGWFAAAVSVQIAAANAARPGTAATVLLVAGAVAMIAALGLGWTRRPAVVMSTSVVAGVLVAAGLIVAGGAHEWSVRDRVGLVLTAGWVTLAVATAGRRRVGEVGGATLGVLFSAGWVGLLHASLTGPEADAVVLLAAVLACGLLPQWALSTSGLAALDDRRLGGASVRRALVRRSLRDAHASLIASTAAVAVTVTVCGVSLARTGSAWPVAAAACAAGVVALRSRALPLAAEGALMLAAASVVTVVLAYTWVDHATTATWPLVATVALAVAVHACSWMRPPEHIRARLRAIGDRLEAAAVIALVPLTVGVFGVFGELLHTFDK